MLLPQVGVDVTPPNPASVPSEVKIGTKSGHYDMQFNGTGTTYLWDQSITRAMGYNYLSYASPVIHHTLVTGRCSSRGHDRVASNARSVSRVATRHW